MQTPGFYVCLIYVSSLLRRQCEVILGGGNKCCCACRLSPLYPVPWDLSGDLLQSFPHICHVFCDAPGLWKYSSTSAAIRSMCIRVHVYMWACQVLTVNSRSYVCISNNALLIITGDCWSEMWVKYLSLHTCACTTTLYAATSCCCNMSIFF